MKRSVSDRPHLVVVCADALRADCLWPDVAGTIWEDVGRPSTPNLDRLAGESRVFRNAHAASSWTKPSVPSMFLSLYPSEHGVLEVAKSDSGAVHSPSLPLERPALAEVLSDAGYRSLGLAHNAQLDPSLGFGRGFEYYTSSSGSMDAILAKLRELEAFRDDVPTFLYAHLIESHWPYSKGVADRAARIARGRFAFHQYKAAEWKALKLELKKDYVSLTADEVRFMRQVYALAIEEVDAAVGQLLDELESVNALERSVVLFTSDHGEELLDRGLVGHGQSLQAELMRIPLTVRVGAEVGTKPFGRGTSDEVVSHVDFLPTLAEWAGAEIPAKCSGRSLLSDAPPPYVFGEVKHKRRYHQAVTDGTVKLIRSFAFRRAKVEPRTRHSDYNNLAELFEKRPYRQSRAFFALASDPLERDERAVREPAWCDALEAALESKLKDRARPGSASFDLEDEMIRRLEALGYL